jgi:hypothetical protein
VLNEARNRTIICALYCSGKVTGRKLFPVTVIFNTSAAYPLAAARIIGTCALLFILF